MMRRSIFYFIFFAVSEFLIWRQSCTLGSDVKRISLRGGVTVYLAGHSALKCCLTKGWFSHLFQADGRFSSREM